MFGSLQYIRWNLDPVIFGQASGYGLRWYSVLMMVSIYISFSMLSNMYQEGKLSGRQHTWLITFVTIGCLIGARLGHFLFYDFDLLAADPMMFFRPWEGGLASHGAVIGIFTMMLIYVKFVLKEKSFFWVMDRLALSLLPGTALIRVGNFTNSELYGDVTDMPWGVIFESVDQLPRHPVQLYEAFSYGILLVIFLYWYRKNKTTMVDGQLTGMLMVSITLIRFCLEFVKDSPKGTEIFGMFFYTGQLLSLPFIIFGTYLVVNAIRKKKQQVNADRSG